MNSAPVTLAQTRGPDARKARLYLANPGFARWGSVLGLVPKALFEAEFGNSACRPTPNRGLRHHNPTINHRYELQSVKAVFRGDP